MSELKDLQPGDEALLVDGGPSKYRREPRMVKIAKRGRKYFTVGEGWQAVQFDMHTGRQNVNIGYADSLWIPEQYEAHLEAVRLRGDLRKAGLQFWQAKLTDDQIAAIHKIVCGGAA